MIPTYQRRDLVIATVSEFVHQRGNVTFEVIVVVDGSTDDTAQALSQLELPFSLQVKCQSNRGRASALNHGIQFAQGETLLFLDDDMHPDADLLMQHALSHAEGADLVLGHIPVHEDYRGDFLGKAVQHWTEERRQRLADAPTQLTLHDLITGQASVTRTVFDELGGFDENFNREGKFGNEDLDFCVRLQQRGYRVVFNPKAIAWQKYDVSPRHLLRQWYQAGQADVMLAGKHRHLRRFISSAHRQPWLIERLWTQPLCQCLLWLVEHGMHHRLIRHAFFYARMLEYARGVRRAGGMPGIFPVRVLAYHAIADLQGLPILSEYGIPGELFERQLDALLGAGFTFISPDQFLAFLRNEIDLDRKSLLLTFDDCYSDLLLTALPILQRRQLPALAFAVSGRSGGFNDWDEAIGAPQLRLLDAAQLHQLENAGIEIGAHSRNHVLLSTVTDPDELAGETTGSVADLESTGLKRPRFYSYPHGDFNESALLSLQVGALEGGFTVEPGTISPHHHCYQLPRIEILRSDGILRMRLKIMMAGLSPASLFRFRQGRAGGARVSVIIPAFNAADTLAVTLASLRAQCFTQWQAIVVDDGSTDDTAEIARQWAREDSRIDLICQENGGEGAARNTGILAAAHEWLLFLDADDWITPDCLSTMLRTVAKDASLAGVVCGCVRVTPEGALCPADVYSPWSLDDLFLQFAKDCPFAIHNCMVSRHLALQVGLFDTGLRTCADWDFWQRIARTGARFTSVPEVLSAYRMRPGSASSFAERVQQDGFTVLSRGHSADDRVSSPHPDHRHGAAKSGLREAMYRHSLWPASLLIGQHKDARVLLDAFAGQPFQELSPVVVADGLFNCIPLAASSTPSRWPVLWTEFEQSILEYLEALEKVSESTGLAFQAARHLERLVLEYRSEPQTATLGG
ncbi:MAG: glycosyltransferase, partial [Granulosicoccus sp.]|nr:glycosyltransferase [Granulosicoccus sp.]